MLALRSNKGGFEDLYPSAEPLSAGNRELLNIAHGRVLEFCDESEVEFKPYLQKQAWVTCKATNHDFEQNYGAMLQESIRFQDA